MHPFKRVIVSEGSFASADPHDLVQSNVSVINLLQDENFPLDLCAKEALQSYGVDFYRAQLANGGFSQFVYNSRLAPAIVDAVSAGLAAMGAQRHELLFRELLSRARALAPGRLEDFYASAYFGHNPTRDLLNDARTTAALREEDLVMANHAYLRSLPLQVLPIEEMFTEIELHLGHAVARS